MKRTLPSNAICIPESANRVFKGVIFDVYQWPQTKIDWFVALYVAIDISNELEPQVDTGGEKISLQWRKFDDFRSDLLNGTLPSMQYLMSFMGRVETPEKLLALPKFKGEES